MYVNKYLVFLFIVTRSAVCDKEQQIFPDYYNITSKGASFQNYSYMFGFYKKIINTHNIYPTYEKTNGEYSLYMFEGHWSISGERRFMHAKENGSLSPPSDDTWEYKDGDSWIEGRVLIQLLTFPDSYKLDYTGTDAEVRQIFRKEYLAGLYNKQMQRHNDNVLYMKENPKLLYLMKSENEQWMVSSYLMDADASKAHMYQDMTSDPVPDKNAPWFVKIGGSYGDIKDISLSFAYLEIRDFGDKTVLIISLSVVFVLLVLAVIAVVVCLKRRMKPAEEPVVDDNMYYGNPGEDYVYGTTRVTDTNDYYSEK